MSELYEAMLEAWLERESIWSDKDALRMFSEHLAVDIYTKRQSRGSESVPYDNIEELARAWHINLKNWQITGRSLLKRDANGNVKFAHRSIMEFLYIRNY